MKIRKYSTEIKKKAVLEYLNKIIKFVETSEDIKFVDIMTNNDYDPETEYGHPTFVTHYLKDGWIKVRLEIKLKNKKINNEWRKK